MARRHGRLRGGAAASFLRSDDEVLIAEVLAHPQTGELELRRIAPTVVVSPLPLVELLDGLRAAGFSPAAEDTGGAVLDLTDRGRRTAPRRRPAAAGSALPPEPDTEQLAALVSRMRAGDALTRVRRGAGSPRAGNGSAVDLLRAAVPPATDRLINSWTGAGPPARSCSNRSGWAAGWSRAGTPSTGWRIRVPLHRITSIADVAQDGPPDPADR